MDLRSGLVRAIAVAAAIAGLCCHAVPAAAQAAGPEVASVDYAGQGASKDDGGMAHACCASSSADAVLAEPSSLIAGTAFGGTSDLPAPVAIVAAGSFGRRDAVATGPPVTNRALARLGAYRS